MEITANMKFHVLHQLYGITFLVNPLKVTFSVKNATTIYKNTWLKNF